MLDVLYLTSSDMVPGTPGRADLFELDQQLQAVTKPCEKAGIRLNLQVWDQPWQPAQAAVVGTTWDYTQRVDVFLETLDTAQIPVLNPPSILRWNAHKGYLRALERAGIPTIPTEWHDQLQPAHLEERHTPVVIKRTVGAGAKDQLLWHPGTPLPQLPAGEVMVQPFIPDIVTHGEISLLYFGGHYSHGVRKLPAEGDYRIQSIYGGYERPHNATSMEREMAEAALAQVDEPLLYARVDLIDTASGPLLIELELIEPFLYPLQGPGMGELFAASLRKRL